MRYEELLDITPGMFLALNQQRLDLAKDRMLGFQFLATVVARIAGNKDANFMPDGQKPQGWTDDGAGLASFFEARVNGQGGADTDQATEGIAGCDEEGGIGD